VEAETKRINVILNDKERELEAVIRSLEHERDEKVDLVNEKERIEKERKEELERMNDENTELKAKLDELNERIKSDQIGAEGKSHVCTGRICRNNIYLLRTGKHGCGYTLGRRRKRLIIFLLISDYLYDVCVNYTVCNSVSLKLKSKEIKKVTEKECVRVTCMEV
jgi:hypothetical protein